MLNDSARTFLKGLVRDALVDALNGRELSVADCDTLELQAECGCFVTLKTHGQLRGCLGRFTSDLPLWKTVPLMTRQSALEDPRFAGSRLRPEDLPQITYDISILSPLQPCADPRSIELGRDGIYIRQGMRSGCFLPQVATETGWSIEEFWGHCCQQKAGLAPNAWEGGGVERFTFTAEVIEGRAIES
ncbi:MAG: AmmeMemoRadiSam system protein A [Planctomycetota bacterium]|jgi:AmmeMemoRadiSam system protein A